MILCRLHDFMWFQLDFMWFHLISCGFMWFHMVYVLLCDFMRLLWISVIYVGIYKRTIVMSSVSVHFTVVGSGYLVLILWELKSLRIENSENFISCLKYLYLFFLSIPSRAALRNNKNNLYSYIQSKIPSQTQSLEVVGLHLQTQWFSHGQHYVACSRVGRPDNLFIYTPDSRAKNVVYQGALQ